MLVSRGCGEQDILRAELEAICFLVCTFHHGYIHTDSQAGINMISKVRSCDHPSHFYHMEHFDLLLKIWAFRHEDWFLHKVKSHVDLASITDPLDRYWHIGNSVADAAAQAANGNLIPDFVASLREQTCETQKQAVQLAQIFRLHLQLHQVRLIAEQNLE